jgi:hypothetical protein
VCRCSPPIEKASGEANFLWRKERMQKFTPSLLKGKWQSRWASDAWWRGAAAEELLGPCSVRGRDIPEAAEELQAILSVF